MINILYEDNHIIVAVKDAGILSQKGDLDLPNMNDLIKDYIKEKYQKPGNVYLGLVHRLDLNTKGIMVFAKTSKAAKRLSDEIKDNIFNKEYYALVEGEVLNKDYIKLENNLIKDEKEKKSYVNSEGKKAILYYKSVDVIKDGCKCLSILDIKLETGRFHQIRCQLSNLGHPVYRDIKYGSKEKWIKDYPLLYAYKLSFEHPVTKEELTFKLDGVIDEIRTNYR